MVGRVRGIQLEGQQGMFRACREMLHTGKGSCLPFGCLIFVGILVVIRCGHGYRCTDTFRYQEVATLNSRVAFELSCCASGSLFQPCHLAINHHHESSTPWQ